MRLLLVEDDAKIATFVVKGMQQAGFLVDHASDGVSGLKMALGGGYDGAIVDIMLPQLDGLSLIESLRQRKIDLPVIILSAKRSVDDRIKGLQQGGDDYLTKPFAFSELLARVQALLRRASNTTEPSSLVVHDLSVDLLARTVVRAGKKISLQPKEFSLLVELEGLVEDFGLENGPGDERFSESGATLQLGLEAAPLDFAKGEWVLEFDTLTSKFNWSCPWRPWGRCGISRNWTATATGPSPGIWKSPGLSTRCSSGRCGLRAATKSRTSPNCNSAPL
jgi:two-component system OmpR family response regulator